VAVDGGSQQSRALQRHVSAQTLRGERRAQMKLIVEETRSVVRSSDRAGETGRAATPTDRSGRVAPRARTTYCTARRHQRRHDDHDDLFLQRTAPPPSLPTPSLRGRSDENDHPVDLMCSDGIT